MDVIDALLERSIELLTRLIAEVENFVEENKHLGYTTREEFIRDSVRTSLKKLSEGKTCLEIPKKDSDELERAMKEMKLPFTNTTDFVYNKIRKALKEHSPFFSLFKFFRVLFLLSGLLISRIPGGLINFEKGEVECNYDLYVC